MKKNNNTPINTQTFNDRVNFALKKISRSKSWFANEIGLSRQALHYFLSKESGGQHLAKMAETLKVNHQWLETGEGEAVPQEKQSSIIPLLNIKDVIPWVKGTKNKIRKTISVDHKSSGDIFAVTLDDTIEGNELGKISILICKISLVPTSGDYVLIQQDKKPIIALRKYICSGSKNSPSSLKETHTTIDDTDLCSIIGVIIEQRSILYEY